MEMSNQLVDMNTVMYPEITGTGKPEGNRMGNKQPMQMNEKKKDSMLDIKMNDMKGMDMSKQLRHRNA
jgi:hypothetical protein